MADMASLLKRHQKKYGESVGNVGGALVEYDRIPTGFFSFDLASGGGFPRGKVSTVFGPESSGKSNLVLRSIAGHQKLWPDKVCVYVAIEEFHPDWAEKLGVDCSKLIVVKPDYAEQAVDMIADEENGFLHSPECGLVVLDSIAAMITTTESENSAEKANYGGSSLVVGKLVRKVSLALRAQEKKGLAPTVILVNQIRFKMGVTMGNPEIQPGGEAPKFAASMIVRTYGKNHIDSKISKIMPVAKTTTFTIKKWKCPIFCPDGTYTMVTLPHAGFECGEADDSNTVLHYAKQFNLLAKGEKKGWVLEGESYNTLDEIKHRMRAEKTWALEFKARLMKAVMAVGLIAAQDGGESDVNE